MIRSILAILAGFVAVVALSLGTDALLQGLGILPENPAAMSDGLFALAAGYRTLFTIAGGALTAVLSPTPRRDVAILAGLGFLAGLAGVAAWFATPGLGPFWYAAAIPVTGAAGTLIGGRLAR